MKRNLLLLILFLCLGLPSRAQDCAVSTNLIDWASMGTVNFTGSVSFLRKFSFEAGIQYNTNEKTRKSGLVVADKQINNYAGLRYWPWYVYSGWWVEAKAKWSDFYRTGLWNLSVEEGRANGAGVYVGYTWMLTKHINLDFGVGAWSGKLLEYNRYHCSHCLELVDSGPRTFVEMDDVVLSLMFVF